MNKRTGLLQLVTIPKPCESAWDEMTGDSGMRFCLSCGKHVHSLSALTRSEAEALLAASRGMLCAKIERRSDGSIVTLEDPGKSAGFRPRFLRGVGAALSAALSAAPVAAQTHTALQQVISGDEQRSPEQGESGEAAVLYGTVSDLLGDKIPRANVELSGQSTGAKSKAVTDNDGRYQIEALAADRYIVNVSAVGFKVSRSVTEIRAGQSARLDQMLQISDLMGDVVMIEPHRTAGQKLAAVMTYPFRKLKRR